MNKNFDRRFFGIFIKKRRKEMGLSQKVVSEIIGVSLKGFKRIERGEYDPPIGIFFRLCELFNINLETYRNVFFW